MVILIYRLKDGGFMKKIFIVLVMVFMFYGCSSDLNYETRKEEDNTVYEIEESEYVISEEETDLVMIEVEDIGIMIAELYPNIAPITVKNFKKLVGEKFYDGLIFHRVIKDFMIQTGDPTATGTGGSDEKIKGEFSINGVENDLSHKRGILSMARAGSNPETKETMNSASSQFFIVHKDSEYLDGKYAAFGKLINGYDVLDEVAKSLTDENDKPINEKKIKKIRFVSIYGE